MNDENTDRVSCENEVQNNQKKKWVKFEDSVSATNDATENGNKVAIIEPETVHVNIPTPQRSGNAFSGAIISTESVHVNVNHPRSLEAGSSNASENVKMRTIDLHETSNGVDNLQSASVIRQGFGSYDRLSMKSLTNDKHTSM